MDEGRITAPDLPSWLMQPVIQAVLHKLIDMTDLQPVTDRARPPGFRVAPKTLPVFFDQPGSDELAFAWSLLEALEKWRWVDIQRSRVKPGYAPYELEPRLLLVPCAERAIRDFLGRPLPSNFPSAQWRAAVEARVWAGDPSLLARQPICVEGMSAEAVVERLQSIPDLASAYYLREISALLFQGLSKVIEGRLDALRAAFGPEVPLLEKPLLINAHLPDDRLSGILFVENEATYHVLCRVIHLESPGYALVWSSGFMGAALRVRQSEGASLHFSATSAQTVRAEFDTAWFDRGTRLPMQFFGDLDFSGMAILRQMRHVFPQLIAWEPGYRILLRYMRDTGGHAPLAADKVGQRDPGETGCSFADSVLLPELRRAGRFVDQEVWLPWTQLADRTKADAR